jgi:tetratricopeptide (TPR) repeat protein
MSNDITPTAALFDATDIGLERFGNTSSILSLSVKYSAWYLRATCVGSVDIPLGTLLATCADKGCMYDSNRNLIQSHKIFIVAALELTSDAITLKGMTTGIITVKFQRLGDHSGTAVKLQSNGASQPGRFESLEEPANIGNQQRSVELKDERPQNTLASLSNLNRGHKIDPEDVVRELHTLGLSQFHRYQRLGKIADLENAIANQQRVEELTDDRHPNIPGLLSNLGTSLKIRFDRLGELTDLDNAIAKQSKAVELTKDGHPDNPMYLSSLGNSQRTRFDRIGKLDDLENAISNQQRAVELTNDHHPNKPGFLSNLGSSQKICFDRLGQLTDLENSISNQQRAVELTDNGNPNFPSRLSNLGNGQETRFNRIGELADLENAISNKQKAVELTDDSHPTMPRFLSNLGSCQAARFVRHGELADLDDAISNYRKAVQLTEDRHPNMPGRLCNLGNAQERRFHRLGQLADLENAISNQQKAVELTQDDHPNKSTYFSNLGTSQRTRFQHLGELVDLEKAISNQRMAVELMDHKHPKMPARLYNLGNSQQSRFNRLGKLNDLENAISNKQHAVELTDEGHPSMPFRCFGLGSCQETRFHRLGQLADLENAISNKQQAVDLTDDNDPRQSALLIGLGNSQQTRFEQLGDVADLAASVATFKAAARLKSAYPRLALDAARKWARVSHQNGDLASALDGYRTALETLPKVAWLGLDAPSHHDWLLRERSENLGCLAATCAIQLGCLEEAVELLDVGRSVFWQQASSLRSDSETLRVGHPELAKELESVGRKLDMETFSGLPSAAEEHGGIEIDNIEDFGKERRRLVGIWEGLVERVRQLPQFAYFLKPVPFPQLRQAVSTGRVVIINISEYGVDALIFSAIGAIEHVPLPKITLDKLTELSSIVILNRSSDARAPEDPRAQRRNIISNSLQTALRMVWHIILVPIFDRIHVLLEDIHRSQHRIWWYPTGPLTFLPIHAAGPREGTIDVSRIIISSYVTTLYSLFQSQKANRSIPAGQLKFLAISQPQTPGHSPLPQSTREVLGVIQAACSAGWPKDNVIRLDGPDATIEHALNALDTCSLAHFACHGFQDPILGTKSAFALHNGSLELGQIASKRLFNGRFAFLSACHAASGLKELPGEAMHLAAGLQFAGFPSVIATMWGIRDEDAPKVAEHTYQYLFRNGLDGFDPSDAATALNRAVLHLREDPNITVDRWAPFIHFGI